MSHGESLLSKVLDDGTTDAFKRFGIEETDFGTAGEQSVYKFIEEYARSNGGKAPDYRTVVEHNPDFYYREGTTDSYEWLARKVKDESGLRKISELVGGQEAQELFSKKDFTKLSELLISEVESIKLRTSVREKVGTDVKSDTDKYLKEYRERKAGTSFRIWKSKFETINKEIGGYYSGNMYAWYGRSGRGKSIFTMEDGAIEPAFQGANVLVWAREMSGFEWMSRAYASISARRGFSSATIEGVDYSTGFENRALLSGKLTDEWEEHFEYFLRNINEILPGNITVRAIDDEDFMRADVRQLETDIRETNADVVVVDPIYLMDFERNTSKTAGGDIAETSKRLRALAGRTKTVIHVVTQAEEVKDDMDAEGHRELRAPRRAEVKKTKAILEDSANLFGIDSLDGRGLIEIGKGRQGGEGTVIEVRYLPNYGIVVEDDPTEEAAKFNVDYTEMF